MGTDELLEKLSRKSSQQEIRWKRQEVGSTGSQVKPTESTAESTGSEVGLRDQQKENHPGGCVCGGRESKDREGGGQSVSPRARSWHRCGWGCHSQ